MDDTAGVAHAEGDEGMRTYARLRALAAWTDKTVCRGHLFKQEPKDRDITNFEEKVEPAVYIAYTPKRYDESNAMELIERLESAAPSIIIMPTASHVKYVEPQRFDQYKGIHRPKEMGQELNVQVLFTLYEDGVRLPGFIEKYERTGEFDISLVREGTQEGLQALLDWMDEFKDAMLVQQIVPNSDLILSEDDFNWGMRTNQNSIADDRPLYFGLFNIGFNCVAEYRLSEEISAILD